MTKPSINFAKQIDRVVHRQWVDLRNVWPQHAVLIDPSGSAPEESLEDLPAVRAKALELLDGGDLYVEADVVGTRALMLRTALFLLHKASHVIAAAEVHADGGIRSWAVSSAYEGSLMAARAIMMLLGVSILDFDQRTVLVDVFAMLTKKSKKQPDVMTTRLLLGGRRVGHREVWQLFQRLIRVAAVDVWPDSTVSFLKTMETSDIPRQRNRLHYSHRSWLFDDLFMWRPVSDFGVVSGLGVPAVESDGFSVAFSLLLLELGRILVEDLSALSNLIAAEYGMLRTMLEQKTMHPIYARSGSSL